MEDKIKARIADAKAKEEARRADANARRAEREAEVKARIAEKERLKYKPNQTSDSLFDKPVERKYSSLNNIPKKTSKKDNHIHLLLDNEDYKLLEELKKEMKFPYSNIIRILIRNAKKIDIFNN